MPITLVFMPFRKSQQVTTMKTSVIADAGHAMILCIETDFRVVGSVHSSEMSPPRKIF